MSSEAVRFVAPDQRGMGQGAVPVEAGSAPAGAVSAGAGAAAVDWGACVRALAGFFFTGRFLAGAGGGGAFSSSTKIGLGSTRAPWAAPSDANRGSSGGINFTGTLWDTYPLSETLTVKSPLACSASAQGVRQLPPEDALASAPGGSLSTVTVTCWAPYEDEPNPQSDMLGILGMLGIQDGELHADKVKPHATMAMTRLMIVPINCAAGVPRRPTRWDHTDDASTGATASWS